MGVRGGGLTSNFFWGRVWMFSGMPQSNNDVESVDDHLLTLLASNRPVQYAAA
jgi:hypothetical protein